MNDRKRFDKWMWKVDTRLSRLTFGLTSGDMADQTWWDWWASGKSVEEAAEDCLVDEGFFDFVNLGG
jgi:hypothetical protein